MIKKAPNKSGEHFFCVVFSIINTKYRLFVLKGFPEEFDLESKAEQDKLWLRSDLHE